MTIRLSHLVASDVPLPPGAEAVPVAGLTADSRAVRRNVGVLVADGGLDVLH